VRYLEVGMPIFGQTEFKARLLEIGREAVGNGERVYVRDKRGKLFMTLDPRQDRKPEPIIPISIQRFRDDLAQFASLVRRGFMFNLTQRGSFKALVARRHSKYRDPLDGIVDEWTRMIAKKAAQEQANRDSEVKTAAMAAKASNDRVIKWLEEISLDVARVAVGHQPPAANEDDDLAAER
jgi:hypothetical protein